MTMLLQQCRVQNISQIVDAARLAPSAENMQPWRFIVDDETLTICHDASRTLASDIDQMLSLTAIGACLENAVIAASEQCLAANIEYLVDPLLSHLGNSSPPIARIRFLAGADRDPLADFIVSRCTSRRMEYGRLVADTLLHDLQLCCKDYPEVAIHWVKPEQLLEFANLVGIGNRIRFEFKPFQQELYNNLRFTDGAAKQACDGLDVATLQLPLGVAGLMSMLRTWPRVRWANAFGFSLGVARQAAREVLCSGAVGMLSVPAAESRHFIYGGRALERIWLTATRAGLCFHPIASLPVFLAHARAGGNQLTRSHQRVASLMTEAFCRLFPLMNGRTVQIAFRIGHGTIPAVRSLRRPLDDVVYLRGTGSSLPGAGR